MSKSYLEKLKDPRWQKMRLKVLEYANFRCQICGDSKSTLHVHHSYYTRGKEPWQYPQGSMISVCQYHHECIHEDDKPKKKPQTIAQPERQFTPEETRTAESVANAKFGQIFDMLNNLPNE